MDPTHYTMEHRLTKALEAAGIVLTKEQREALETFIDTETSEAYDRGCDAERYSSAMAGSGF